MKAKKKKKNGKRKNKLTKKEPITNLNSKIKSLVLIAMIGINFYKGMTSFCCFQHLNQVSLFFLCHQCSVDLGRLFCFARLKSNLLQMFYKTGVLKNFVNFKGKHLCRSLFFKKVAGLRLATLLKKDSDTGVFR